MRPNDKERPGDIPQFLADKTQISPLANSRGGTREQANPKRPSKRDGERRSGNGRSTDCARRLALPGKLRHALNTKTHIECTLRKAATEALIGAASDQKHDYPRRATNGSLKGLPALIRGLHMSGKPPSNKISTLPPNKATPRHLTTVGTPCPCASMLSIHCHALHRYTTHNRVAPYTPHYPNTTSSLDLHEHAPHLPIRMDLENPHNTASHIIKQKECGAHPAATTFPDKEGT